MTTASDPQGRPTVFEQLPKELGRVISVGRLDLNTEGLLLLTNNGELSRYLELPSTGWTRRYRVRVHGVVDPKKLELLAQGVEYDGVQYGPVIATIEQAQDRANVWIDVAIKEGKNREIRNVMRAIDLEVNRLIRVSYGPFQLGHLPSGAVEAVPARVLLINNRTAHPNAARLWLDYLLSRRGQTVMATTARLYALREDVQGETTGAALRQLLGDRARPVALGPALSAPLANAAYGDFIARWRAALGYPKG